MSVARACRRTVPILVLAAGLSGCVPAAPSAFQVATYAADGASYATTGKTVADHLISTATAKDCAMGRMLDGEDICREKPEGPYARLPDGTLAPNAKDAAMTVRPAEQDEDFQSFATARADKGPFDNAEVIENQGASPTTVRWAEPPAPAPGAGPDAPRAAPVTAVETATLAAPDTAAAAGESTPRAEPQAMARDVLPPPDDEGDEDLAPLIDPSQGGDVMMIGDDADELLSPADIQAIEKARTPVPGQ